MFFVLNKNAFAVQEKNSQSLVVKFRITINEM